MTAKQAMDAVEGLMGTWNVHRINTVSLFQMVEGVVSNEPVLYINYLLKAERAKYPDAYKLPDRKTPVLDHYKGAAWLKKLNTPKPFITVTHKET